ncbi:MAG: hypothetical protein JO275_14410 [Verrucomicrobia bacterium]|nr:hypothetical protein [Verrucomicrobiota bacterium]
MATFDYRNRNHVWLRDSSSLSGKNHRSPAIDVQVLSLTSPGTEQLEAADSAKMASDANNLLAEAVLA